MPLLTITDMAEAAYANSEAHGFWADQPEDVDALGMYFAGKLALIHSEVSEALEEVRAKKPIAYLREDGKPEGVSAELADIVIRVGDFAAALGIDLGFVVEEKMRFNASRPHKHGKAF